MMRHTQTQSMAMYVCKPIKKAFHGYDGKIATIVLCARIQVTEQNIVIATTIYKVVYDCN